MKNNQNSDKSSNILIWIVVIALIIFLISKVEFNYTCETPQVAQVSQVTPVVPVVPLTQNKPTPTFTPPTVSRPNLTSTVNSSKPNIEDNKIKLNEIQKEILELEAKKRDPNSFFEPIKSSLTPEQKSKSKSEGLLSVMKVLPINNKSTIDYKTAKLPSFYEVRFTQDNFEKFVDYYKTQEDCDKKQNITHTARYYKVIGDYQRNGISSNKVPSNANEGVCFYIKEFNSSQNLVKLYNYDDLANKNFVISSIKEYDPINGKEISYTSYDEQGNIDNS